MYSWPFKLGWEGLSIDLLLLNGLCCAAHVF